ncbi:MAG: hypothetical protein JKY43_09500 [Phycisphaerales bacterium]|nr:hypothetical protein [Phycisphaerales bacterium]
MMKTITTIALVTMSGSALAQSGLDIDRAYAAELRADTNTRSSLLGSSGSALDVSIFTQFRYSYNTRDEIAGAAPFGDNDTTIGFSTPRTQIRMSGGVEGTDLNGYVSFDFGGAFDHGMSDGGATGDGGATLREAYATWGLDDNWTFLFGQLKNPFSAESNVAAEHSQGVERSLTNSFFDVGYSQAIALNYSDDEWRFTAVLADGPSHWAVGNTANTYYTAASEADFSLTGRLDWLISGNWDQFNDFASWQGSNTGFRVGAGLHWSQMGGSNPILGGNNDTITVTAWTLDAQYEGDGWGVFASYTSVKMELDLIVGDSLDRTDDGFVLQGNVFFTDQFEAFARYDVIFLDSDATAFLPITAGAEDQYSMFTLGFNYYLVPESHAARFSMDIGFGLDETTGLDSLGYTDGSTTGYLGGPGAEDEMNIRAQFSLLF